MKILVKHLPRYTDDEVAVFHPICESALNIALDQLKLSEEYEVVHHDNINGIIPDYVIKNKRTQNYLLIIEVKRTPEAVSSNRYKNQAQSYITEAGRRRLENEGYYILTNLETTNFFKYNLVDSAVNDQLLQPSPIVTGTFKDNYEDFKERLVNNFKMCIEIAKSNGGEYVLNYNDIISTLSKYIYDIDEWHSAITILGYEFIKSVLASRNRPEVKKWSSAVRYQDNPKQLQTTLSNIDFKALTKGNIKSEGDFWINSVLEKASKIGSKAWDGDEFSNVAHEVQIKGQEHNGVVPTDEELAAALVSITIEDSMINEDTIICDPASGSGNLLSAAIRKYPSINPNQIWANDICKQFRDILTIRFGLKFPTIIRPDISPKITAENLADLSPSDFANVNIILMNPPYLSGVSDSTRKKVFFNKIVEHTQSSAITKIGQMPLEGPFLELLLALIPEGTKIGVVFPEDHLYGKGKEKIAIREMILEKFGLQKIFTYSRKGLFEDVTKGTVILVGEKGRSAENIKVINSFVPLEQLDLIQLQKDENGYGFTQDVIPFSKLVSNVKESWKFALFPSFENLMELIEDNVETIDSNRLKRGRNANNGGKQYLFPTKLSFWNEISEMIPNSWLIPGMNNVRDSDELNLNSKTVATRGLKPPKEAFKQGTMEYDLLNKIMDTIDSKIKVNKNLQVKKDKDRREWLKILKSETEKITSAGKILIPRNLRKNFKIFYLEEDMYLSTNFFTINIENILQKNIMISWLYSIFGQVQLEFYAKPQEGARKTEKGELTLLKIPKMDNIFFSDERRLDELSHEAFPESRYFYDYSTLNNLDEFWTRFLKISSQEVQQFQILIDEMVSLRRP